MQGMQNAGTKVYMPKIVYAQTAYYKNINEAIRNARHVRPFVDESIIVTDIDPLPPATDIKFYQKPWEDDIPTYLNHVIDAAKLYGADWILFSDPDEQFDELFLAAIKQMVLMNPQYNGFKLYCHLNIDNYNRLDDGTLERESPGGLGVDSNYWKMLLYKIEPTTKFVPIGSSDKAIHPTLLGHWNVIKLPKKYFYSHNKTVEDVWSSSVRNQFIAGGGDNVGNSNDFHKELRSICDKLDIKTWREFIKYCEKGNINQELKDLILKHRNDNDKYYSSEIRDVFHWYFDILHPEENQGWRVEYAETTTPETLVDKEIQRAYFKILGRHTDEKGKADYIDKVASGKLNVEQIAPELSTSDEFLNDLINSVTFEITGQGSTDVQREIYASLMKSGIIMNFPVFLQNTYRFLDVKLAYCQMTYKNDLEKTIQNVIEAKPHVDICIVVYDDSLNAGDIQRLVDAGARAKYYKWHHNFPAQRNNYLLEARAYGANWVMVSDPDEHFDKHLFEDAKKLARQADTIGATLLMVNVHDIYTDDEDGKPVENPPEHIPDYHKNLFYKLLPDVAYIGVGETQNLHETMVGSLRSINLPREYFYKHIKSHVEIWEHSARNIFVAGGGMNMGEKVPHYRQLKGMLKRLDIASWYQFNAYLKDGHIDPELKQFIHDHRSDYGHDYDSEYRELFKYYYWLHPDENTDNLKVEPQQPVEPVQPVSNTESYVKTVYKTILKRDADHQGLEHYVREIEEGRLKKDDLETILKSSPEYQAIVTADTGSQMMKI